MQSRVGNELQGTHARIRARLGRYRAAFAAIGCTSTLAIARECHVDPKSVWRLLEGEQVGERVMAQTVAALRKPEYRPLLAEIQIEPTLDSLFEVAIEGVP